MKSKTNVTYALTLIAAVLILAALQASSGFAVSSLSDSSLVVPSVNSISFVEAGNGPDIQTKIDACPTTGCMIIIPPGTYTVTSGILVNKSYIRIIGSGLSTRIVAANSINYPYLIKFQESDYSSIGDLLMFGNSVNQTGTAVAGLHINASVRFSANNLWIQDAWGDGMRFSGVSSHTAHAAQITNIKIYNATGNGIYQQATTYDSEFSNIWIAYSGSNGVNLESGNNFYTNLHVWSSTLAGVKARSNFNKIQGCYVEHNSGKGFDYFSTNKNVITNCDIWANGDVGVTFQDGNYNTVSNSMIHENVGNQVSIPNGVMNEVRGNTIYDGTTSGVLLSTTSQNNTVAMNNFFNLTTGITHSATGQNSMLYNQYTNVTTTTSLSAGLENYVLTNRLFTRAVVPALVLEDITSDGSVGLGTVIGSVVYYTNDRSSSFSTNRIAATINAISNSTFGSQYDLQFNTTISSAVPTEVFRVRGSGAVYLTPKATAPTSPIAGDVYSDTAPAFCWYNGTGWHNLDNRSNDGACA